MLEISADGSAAYGIVRDQPDTNDLPALWNEATGWQILGETNYPIISGNAIMSDDGRLIVGNATFSPAFEHGFGELFYWTNDEGMVWLGIDGLLWASTPDASVVAGTVYHQGETVAPRDAAWSTVRRSPALLWTRDEGIVDIGNGFINDLTHDGSVAVGTTESETGDVSAIVWDRRSGICSLQDLLKNEYGLENQLTGWCS